VPLLVLAALVGCYLTFAMPPLVPVGLAVALSVAWRKMRAPAGSTFHERVVPALVIAISLFLLAMLVDRASTPCFWDAFVWLAKARYAAGGLGGLIAGGLGSRRPPFIPGGYPLFEPLSVALLASFSSRPESVVAGAIGLEVLMTVLFLCTIASDPQSTPSARARRLAAVTLVLLASPLVLVHLRSSYVDLPLGLLVASLAALLPRQGTGVACAIIGVAAASLKDEGMVHVAAISLAGALYGLRCGRDAALVRRALSCGVAAAAVTAGWHLRLSSSGITNADHALSLPDWQRVLPLARASLAHMLELRSWGALWMVGVGAAVAGWLTPRSVPRDVMWFALLLTLDASALFIALLATPGRVMEFVMGGTLLNRLGMQLAPCAALLVAAWTGRAEESVEP
jgi:hypothetical protein